MITNCLPGSVGVCPHSHSANATNLHYDLVALRHLVATLDTAPLLCPSTPLCSSLTHPHIHLPIHPPLHLSIHLPIQQSVYPSYHSSMHLSTHLSIHPCTHPSIFPAIHLSVYPSVHSSVYLPTQPPTLLFLSAACQALCFVLCGCVMWREPPLSLPSLVWSGLARGAK